MKKILQLVILASSFIATKGNALPYLEEVSLFSEANFLYVKPGFSGDQYGLSVSQLDESGRTTTDYSDMPTPFKYEPGVRLVVGVESVNSPWKVNFSWDGFLSNVTTGDFSLFNVAEASNPGEQLFPQFGNQAGLWDLIQGTTELSLRHRTTFNQFDLFLSRGFEVCKEAAFDVILGLRAVSLQNWVHSGWNFDGDASLTGTVVETFSNATSDLRTHFKGIGGVTGLKFKWCLLQGLDLFGSFYNSLLYGKTEASDSYFYFDNITSESGSFGNLDKEYESIKGIVDLSCGLEYSFYFNCDESLFKLHVAYEHHLFYGQNAFRNGNLNTPINFYPAFQANGDFHYRGWVFGASLLF